MNLEALYPNPQDLSVLDAPISEDEVWDTIKKMPSDKAPGPDGFTGLFYKSCWEVIKQDVVEAVGAVHEGDARQLNLINSAYIVLLPKKDDPMVVGDFRPISLVHSVAKLITKILAHLLAPHIGRLVAPNQTTFIRGRRIHDNFLLVQHTARTLHRHKLSRILLKLDISKAFDSVSWPFLLEVLARLGFDYKWRMLIGNLLSSSTTRVLLNGLPGSVITHRRGLRQGDPLSPLLFVIIMDALTRIVVKADQLGLFERLSNRQHDHRMFSYADDMVIFATPTVQDMSLIKGILQVFGEASGLKTNMAKSTVLPIRCQEKNINLIRRDMDCDISSFPCKYLDFRCRCIASKRRIGRRPSSTSPSD